jgi:UDP:flavonoid glycosyltransferase YjiC (YdhE family)
MRVLFVIAPVSTHILPTIPLAWALGAAGHQVLCVSEEPTAQAAAAAGLHHVTVTPDPAQAGAAAPPAKPAPPSGTAGWEPDWEVAAARWRHRIGRVLDQYLAVARDWRPDVIVCDPIEYGALIVGGALGVPTVMHRWGPDNLTWKGQLPARRALRDLCERAGVPDATMPLPSMVLDPCPPSLQPAESRPGTPVRFVPWNGPGGRPVWDRPPGTRTVCVPYSGRTLAAGGVAELAALAEAFAGMNGVQGLIPVAEEFRDKLGDVPSNVRFIDPAPLSLMLDRCHAVAHHGGSGTGLTGFTFGLPQLVLPPALPALEAFATGVTASGAGLHLPADRREDPAALREALRTLLDDGSHAAAAARIRAEIASMPLPAHLVGDLEDLAGSGVPAHAA